VPYVKRAVNPEPAGGGSEGETPDELRVRGPRTLRHSGRAVTAADYEDLVREASSGIARVLAIPARDSETAGRVTLVVVPASGAPKPVPSLELLDRLEEFIGERRPSTAELEVGGPGWIRVNVEVEVVPQSLEAAADVEAAVLGRLAAFLHPLTGGLEATGWPFGRRPHRSDLHKLVEETPGVDHVHWLDAIEVEIEPGPAPDAFLVYSGTHTVRMLGGEASAA
jgi:predicted phage baseplate assembly protein